MTISPTNDVKSKLIRWVAFLLSPAVWITYFLVVYMVDEVVCGLNVLRSTFWGQVTTADLIMLLLTILTLAACGVGFCLGRRLWQHSQQQERQISIERDRFIGLSAMLMGGLFALLTVGMTAVIIVLKPC